MQRRILITALTLLGCGTQVDVGENEERGKIVKPNPLISADAEADTDDEIAIIGQPGGTVPNLAGSTGGTTGIPNLGGPGEGDGGSSLGGDSASDDGDGGGDGNSNSGSSGGGYTLTCFGPNPSVPYDFQTFCDDIPADLKTEFQSAHELVCQDHRTINLALYDVCSWHGDAADITKRRKVLDASDTTDTSLDYFYMLSAYSLTSHSTPEQHLDLIRAEMTDPSYESKYVQIRNSSITNQVEHSSNHYSYHVTLANSAATVSFTANMRFWRISDVLTVVFDYATADKVIIQDHKFLRFLIDVGGGQSRIVGVDEKQIDDAGQHNIAYTNLMDILHQRMEKDYENSLRD